MPRERLRVTLQKQRQPWLEDPTNSDPAYTRVRVRVALAESEVSPRALVETAARLARARAALEQERARLLARAAWVHPAGFARIDLALFKAAPEEIGLRALAALLRCISGGAYPPRFERLQRLYREIVSGRMPKSRTLGGCLITRDRSGLVVVREPSATPSTPLAAGKPTRWDDRFEIAMAGAAKRRLTVAGIGAEGWTQIVRKAPELRKSALPIEARMGLPAVKYGNHVVAVPHLRYGRRSAVRVRFAPRSALAGGLFFIV
jgi:tRNA(Ile)-lysidine synthase